MGAYKEEELSVIGQFSKRRHNRLRSAAVLFSSSVRTTLPLWASLVFVLLATNIGHK